MRYFWLLVAVLFFNSVAAQHKYIPYRIGNKFGLSDQKGSVILAPQYDILEADFEGVPFFKGYRSVGGKMLSSLLIDDKVFITDKPYKEYVINCGIVLATEYRPSTNKKLPANERFVTIIHLYNLKGERLTADDYKKVSIVDDLDFKCLLPQTLIRTVSSSSKYSLFIYDKASQTIIARPIASSPTMELAERNYGSDQPLVYTYVDAAGKGRRITVGIVDNSYRVIKTEDVSKIPPPTEEDEDGYSIERIGHVPDSTQIMRWADIRKQSPLATKRAAELEFKTEEYVAALRKLVRKDGKMYIVHTEGRERNIFPMVYDEIVFAYFTDRYGYTLKDNGKYGLYYYSHGREAYIAPVFDKFPLIDNPEYFGWNAPSIKLFDEKGNFFSYASGDGTIYYKNE